MIPSFKKPLQIAAFVLLLAFLAGPLCAGVVFEIETTDHSGSKAEMSTQQMMAEGNLLKMQVHSGEGSQSEMIFRGDRREMIIVNHNDQSYIVIDEATIQELGAKISDAMKQVEEAMKNVPPAQREMMEKMLKGRMPAMPTAPDIEIRKSGESGTHAGMPWIGYEVLISGERNSTSWVADWKSVEGGSEVAEAFGEMSDFMRSMIDALSVQSGMPMLAGLADNVFAHLRDLEGFPIATKEFDDNGSVKKETTLKSSERTSFSPNDFEPPKGYKRQAMMD